MIGCGEDTLAWFKSYLGDREQSTVIGGLSSGTCSINCGVPQGSVLGPLLFLVYINSIVLNIHNGRYFMYADDLAVAVSNKDPSIARALIQDDLDRISNWCDRFRLTVNADKTQVLWCHGEKCKVDWKVHSLWLKGVELKTVSVFNYLGVLIDSVLGFKEHCAKVISSCNLKLHNLRHICKFADEGLAILMYKQMVLGVFDYGDFVLESSTDDLIDEIETLQNHCLRACLRIRDPRTITSEALRIRCGCKSLISRRRENLLCIMYKYAGDPENVMVPVRALRGNVKVKLKLQRPGGELYRRSPQYRGFLEWNELDAEVQKLPCYKSFVNDVKK